MLRRFDSACICTVIGVPDEDLVEVVKAVVEPVDMASARPKDGRAGAKKIYYVSPWMAGRALLTATRKSLLAGEHRTMVFELP